MDKINQFSIQRFILLIKRQILLNAKNWLVGLGAIAGILIIVSLLQSYLGKSFNLPAMVNLGITLIFVVGYMLTSGIYSEIHTPARSQFYLTLPATTAEKLFSNWAITSLLYVLISFILLSLSIALTSLLASLLFGTQTAFFNPFQPDYLKVMGVFVVTHSIFFLGSLYFRKNNFLKTVLAIFILVMALSMIGGLLMYLLFEPGLNNIELSNQQLDPAMQRLFEETIPQIARIIFWAVLAPFFVLVSYFKLKEREV
ncbi:MAG: hypothetical protein ACK4VN_10705 [Bacteroidales bacterium]